MTVLPPLLCLTAQAPAPWPALKIYTPEEAARVNAALDPVLAARAQLCAEKLHAPRGSAPGHEFGLKLSPTDRAALIAFLKTL